MFKKHYGLVYLRGRWIIRNYGRPIKGGMFRWIASYKKGYRNARMETPVIELKRIVPRPGPPEDYQGDLEKVEENLRRFGRGGFGSALGGEK